jgi:hypothetical protein
MKTGPKKAIRALLECGVKLEARSETVASAAVYMHRFFGDRHREQAYDPLLVAATCLYLAGKVEEDHFRVRDIINVFHATANPGREPLDLSEAYWSLRDSIVQCELFVLRVLKFNVTNQHPHRFLLHYCKSLSDWIHGSEENKGRFARTCWALLNDYVTDSRYITHHASHIAVAIIELSLSLLGIEVPSNHEALLGWNEAFSENVSKDSIQSIISEMISVYEPFMDSMSQNPSTPSPFSSHSESPMKYTPQKVIQYPN